MIEVTKSVNADSRSAENEFTIEDLDVATGLHVMDVHEGLFFFMDKLSEAAWNHDYTKGAYMEEFYEALKSGNVKESKWYKMHISTERHHLLSNPPEDVNLVDVLEHITDCVMAGMARTGEIYDVDLPADLLQKAVKNTVKLLKSQITVVEDDVH